MSCKLRVSGTGCSTSPCCESVFSEAKIHGPCHRMHRKLKLLAQDLMNFVPCRKVRRMFASEADFQPRTRKQVFTARIMSSKLAANLLLLLLTITLTTSGANSYRAGKYLSDYGGSARCERIEIKLCRDVGYNYTNLRYSPSNIFRQPEANDMVSVVSVACSGGSNFKQYSWGWLTL